VYRKRRKALRSEAFAPRRARAAQRQNSLSRPAAFSGGLTEAKIYFASVKKVLANDGGLW